MWTENGKRHDIEPKITVDFNFEGMAFIVLDYIFTKSVQSELCFTLRKPAHATYSDFFYGCKNDNFQSKSFDYFHIFAQNRLWVHVRTASVLRWF